MAEELILVTPTLDLASAFLEMNKEYREYSDQEKFKAALDLYNAYDYSNLGEYIQKLNEQSQGLNLQPGYVPATTYWLVSENRDILAVSRLRHWLTPSLEDVGGHIGYTVRPLQRGKGFGTRLLALTLERANTLGLTRVLITCDKDNYGSIGVICKNGGKLSSEGISQASGKKICVFGLSYKI